MVALDFTPCIQRSTALTQCEEKSLRTSEKLGRAFRSNARFVLLLVLVLSIAVLVLDRTLENHTGPLNQPSQH